MGNPYRDLMNNGRVASGAPPVSAPRPAPPRPAARPKQGGGSGQAPPTQGPIPPGPYPGRAGDAPPGTPLGTPGWQDTPPILGGGPPISNVVPSNPFPSPTPTPGGGESGFSVIPGLRTGGQAGTANRLANWNMDADAADVPTPTPAKANNDQFKGKK